MTLELPPRDKIVLVSQKLYEIVEREIDAKRKNINPEKLMVQAIREAGLA